MADVELQTALSSGAITNIQIGGVGTGEKVLTKDEIEAIASDFINKDGSTPADKMTWAPVDPVTVPYIESTTYYNQDAGTFDIKGKYSDVTLQTGREQHVEVVNNSGGGFLNGQAVRYDSVAAGIPAVVLAQADTFMNAGGIGVCTHDIADTEEGIVTSFGKVSGINLSAFNDGDILYLSDVTPGGYTTTPPDIATRIGIVFDNDAINGVLFVNAEVNVSLPPVLGLLQGQAGTGVYNLTATPKNVDDYFIEGSVVMVTSKVNGTIDIPIDGFYNGAFTASLSFASATSTRTIYVEIFETTSLGVIFTYPFNVPRDATEQGVSFSAKFAGTGGEQYVMRLRSSPNMTVTIGDVDMDIDSVRI